MKQENKLKLRKWLMAKTVTRLAYIINLVGIFYFVAMETDIFMNPWTTGKIGLYIMLMSAATLIGFSFISIKEIGEKMRDIKLDPTLSPAQKTNAYEQLGMECLIQAGEEYQLHGQVLGMTPEAVAQLERGKQPKVEPPKSPEPKPEVTE